MKERTSGPTLNRFVWGISSVVVGLMIASACISLIQFVQRLLPVWDPWYLPGFVFLLALERWYVHQRFEYYSVFSRDWWLSHLAEWVTIAIVLRLLIVFSTTSGSIWDEIQGWIQNNGSGILTVEFIGVLMISVLSWMFAGHIASLMDEYNQDLSDIDPSILAIMYKDKPPTREQIITTVLGTGVGILLLTAFTRLDWNAFSDLQTSAGIFSFSEQYAGSANILFFFVMALLFLAISQFAAHRRTWSTQGIEISRNVVVNWIIYSVLFITVLGLIAFVLPTSYSIGFLQTLWIVLQFIISVVVFLFGLVGFIFGFLFSFFSSFFGTTPTESVSEPVVPPVFDEQILATETPTGSWFDIVRSILFWVALLAVIGYALVYFLRQHRSLMGSVEGKSLFRRIKTILNIVLSWFQKGRDQISRLVTHSVQALSRRRGNVRPPDLFRISLPGKLDPRERIRFYYLALLRRAEESGSPRRGDQTPYDYQQVLTEKYLDVNEEIREMTLAFIEARYSNHPIAETKSDQIQDVWSKIRRAIRRIWRHPEGEDREE